KRSQTRSMSPENGPCLRKKRSCAVLQVARLRSPSPSSQAKAASTSSNRLIATSEASATQAGLPPPSSTTQRPPTRGLGFPPAPSGSRRALQVGVFFPASTRASSSSAICGVSPNAPCPRSRQEAGSPSSLPMPIAPRQDPRARLAQDQPPHHQHGERHEHAGED